MEAIGVSLNVYSLLDIEVVHSIKGPYFVFYNELYEYIKKESLICSLSISHEVEYIVASVICFRK